MLVGDLIMNVRSLGPDNPLLTLSPPTAGAPVAATLTGGTLPNGTYFVEATQLNPWGESLSTVEQPVTTAGGQNGFTLSLTPDIGATALRVYLGNATGTEGRYMAFITGLTPGLAMP